MKALCFVNGRITGVVGTERVCVDESHPNYAKIIEFLQAYPGDWDSSLEGEFIELTDIPKAVVQHFHGKVRVEDGELFYGNERVNDTLSRYVMRCMEENLPYQPLFKFVERLYKNPSRRAINELWTWLEHFEFPITDDGCFLGYKAVRANWYDIHSGTVKNEPGVDTIVRMERNMVDDNWGVACSQGYHVGTYQYAFDFGNGLRNGEHMLLVKVAPEDVVSVPTDCEAQKLRCTYYEIVGEVKERQTDFYSGVDVDSYVDDEEWYDDEDYYEDEEDDELEYLDSCADAGCDLSDWSTQDLLSEVARRV